MMTIQTSKLLSVGMIVLCLLGQTGCREDQVSAATAPKNRQVIQTIGSDTMVNLAQAWAEEYGTVEPETSIEVSGGGSGTGIAALINGTADIANSSRRMEPREISAAERVLGQAPVLHIVGYDALAIFVHPANPLREMTLDQLAEIYSERGPVKNWADLGVSVPGCRAGQMILVSRQSNSGTYHYFRDAILGRGRDFKLGTIDLHGSKDVVELVGRTPCAIGYSGMGYANSHVRMLGVARRAGEAAYPPTVENTQQGLYPISRPLYMYTSGDGKPHLKRFFDWIYSRQGQHLVLANGYVPIPEAERQTASLGGSAPGQMVAD
jgi:phosphate transport system substrate-binding protein